MTQINLMTAIADWDTKASITTPAVVVRKGRGVVFFIDAPVLTATTTNQYLAVVGALGTSYGTYQTPLECKYFPQPQGIMFVVVVPNIDYDRNVDVSLLLLPKEFKAGTATDKQVEILISYDDDFITNESAPIG